MLTASTIAATVASSSSKHFHFKSSDATNQEHKNLYVSAYHTDAGLNDAVLTQDVNTASSVYLNGTNALFDFNTKFPWGFVATGDTKYTCEYTALEIRILIIMRPNERFIQPGIRSC
jgi:hypothetical protein